MDFLVVTACIIGLIVSPIMIFKNCVEGHTNAALLHTVAFFIWGIVLFKLYGGF